MIADAVPTEAQMHFLNVTGSNGLVVGRVGTMHDQHVDRVGVKKAVRCPVLTCHRVLLTGPA